MKDLRTMIWKEWRETIQAGNRRSLLGSLLVALILIAVVFPLQQGEEWLEGGAVIIWAVAPLILLPQAIADAFAGERERHTLETLLATRLPDRALLLGKIITPVLWSWAFVQAAMLTALVPAGLHAGALRFYRLDVLLAGWVLSFLMCWLVAGAGVLLSLRASTVRQAQQYIGLVTLSFFFLPLVGIFMINLLPPNVQQQMGEMIQSGNLAPLVLLMVSTLVLLDAALLWLAGRRFKRARLILD